jgi:hypothetical protein
MPERTPEQLDKETGEALGFAIANGLEPILMRLADAIATVQTAQNRFDGALGELARQHRELYQHYHDHLRELHGG